MKCLMAFALTAGLIGQGQIIGQAQTIPPLSRKDAEQLATRMVQLIESTAFAVPGLIQASAPIKQSAGATLAGLQHSPLNGALTYQLMNQVKAYLALSDSIPRPNPFPPAADQQFSELREDLQRMQRHFEAILQAENQAMAASDADPNGLKRYAEADAKMLPAGKDPRVVFMGDSITEEWRLNEYFIGRDFVNRGIAGQNTTQMVARFRQDVLGVHPRAVVVLAGVNDIGEGVALQQIEDNLTVMGDLAKAHGIAAAFASLLPVSDYHKDADPQYERTKTRPNAAIQTLNRWIEGHCRSEGFVFVNYYAGMVDASGQLRTDLSDDGLHPNPKGYRVMSPVVTDAVARVLAAPADDAAAKRRFRLMGK